MLYCALFAQYKPYKTLCFRNILDVGLNPTDSGLSPQDFGLGLADSGLGPADSGPRLQIFRTGSDRFPTESLNLFGINPISGRVRILSRTQPEQIADQSEILSDSVPNLSDQSESDPKPDSWQHKIILSPKGFRTQSQ